MDPWKDPPGWRTELGWCVATSLAALLVLLALPMAPVMWLAGRWSERTGSR